MNLFLMRHGEASFDAPSDMERPLTSRGQIQTETVIKQNFDYFANISSIIASPYLRAQQTAKIVSDQLGLKVTTLPFFTPDSSPNKAVDALYKIAKGEGEPMLVTHMPLVGALTSLLVRGDTHEPEAFMTSHIALLQGEELLPGCMTLKQLFIPTT